MTEERLFAALSPERLTELVREVARPVPGDDTVGAPIGLLVARVQELYPLEGHHTYVRTERIIRQAAEAAAGLRYVVAPG